MYMKYTSAKLNKILKKLEDEHQSLITEQQTVATYTAYEGEDIEDHIKMYDYEATQIRLRKIEEYVRTIKHAINEFNATTKVAGFDMTIDQLLIYIPQLNARKNILATMAGRHQKERYGYGNRYETITGKLIREYTYANYDVNKAKQDYLEVCDLIRNAQLELDSLNNNAEIKVDIDIDI